GSTTMPIGPMFAWLCTKPVAKGCAVNGLRTDWNSEAWADGELEGMPCWACTNKGLVDGCGLGAGGVPRATGVGAGTVGKAPRLAPEPSSGAWMPAGGGSRLPALSVARPRNW